MNYYELFYNCTLGLVHFLLFVAVIFGIRAYTQLNRATLWFLYYLCFMLVVVMVTTILSLTGIWNLHFYPIYQTGEFLILSIMFALAFSQERFVFYVIGILSILLFYEVSTSYAINKNTFAGMGKVLCHLTVITLSCKYLLKSLTKGALLQKDKFVLICQLLLFYYSSSLILFLMLDQLKDISMNTAYLLWGINSLLLCILYGFSSLTFIKSEK